MIRRRLAVLVGILGALSSISIVLAVRASAPVGFGPVDIVWPIDSPRKTRFPIRHMLFPSDPRGILGKSLALQTPLMLEELVVGLSLPDSSSLLVVEWVQAAQAEIQALRSTPDAFNRTWDSIVHSGYDCVDAERVHYFRQQRVPGTSVTFDERQFAILDDLRDRIEAELQRCGQEPLSRHPPFLLPLLHQSIDWWNWHAPDLP